MRYAVENSTQAEPRNPASPTPYSWVEDSALWVVAICQERWMAEAVVEAAARVEHSMVLRIRDERK